MQNDINQIGMKCSCIFVELFLEVDISTPRLMYSVWLYEVWDPVSNLRSRNFEPWYGHSFVIPKCQSMSKYVKVMNYVMAIVGWVSSVHSHVLPRCSFNICSRKGSTPSSQAADLEPSSTSDTLTPGTARTQQQFLLGKYFKKKTLLSIINHRLTTR